MHLKKKKTLVSNTGREFNHYVQLKMLYIHTVAEMNTVKKKRKAGLLLKAMSAIINSSLV